MRGSVGRVVARRRQRRGWLGPCAWRALPAWCDRGIAERENDTKSRDGNAAVERKAINAH
jgi:hypothetical protein